MPTVRSALGHRRLRRCGGGDAGGGADDLAGRRAAAVPARARRPGARDRFLNPSLDHLHDPMLLADMRVAVDRILGAIARKERIAIHGDYDVDGITSTVILRRALELLGADVVHFIPERLRDGYGLQPAAIERLHADGVALVISVDCGIRGAEAARRARELGVDLIITDHHEPDAELPPALAVINPKRHDCTYPDKYLAGVGVALKLVQALCRARRPRQLAAGLRQDRRDRHARRRRAAGRREPRHRQARARPADAAARTRSACARCSTSSRPDRQDDRQLPHRLHARAARQRRRPHEHARHRDAPAAGDRRSDGRRGAGAGAAARRRERRAGRKKRPRSSRRRRRSSQTDPDVGARSVLVVAGEGWHRGVIGIVASKLVDAFHRPAIVLSIEDGVAHGSCRSIPRFDMLGALERCAAPVDRASAATSRRPA